MSVPTMAWRMATLIATSSMYAGKVSPRNSTRSWTAGASSPVPRPTSIGVPTAPKLTGVLWMTRPTITAAIAGKPSASSSGATTAAGVPKPDAPSMKLPNSQPMMIAWTRRSGLMLVKPARMVDIAPLLVRVSSRSRAPKTMYSSVPAMSSPWMLEASTAVMLISQTSRATSTTTTKPIGIAILAGSRNPTRSTPTTAIGDSASRLRTARLSMPWTPSGGRVVGFRGRDQVELVPSVR